MELNLPVLVRLVNTAGRKEPVHNATLLFMPDLHAQDESLQRALNRLIQRAKKHLDELGTRSDHRALTSLVANPELKTRRLKLQLDLRKRIARVHYLLICIRQFDRLLVFNPMLPHLWFEADSQDELPHRATEVYQLHFRQLAKNFDDADEVPRPEKFNTLGNSWVTSIEVDINTQQKSPADEVQKMLSLWSSDEMDGGVELNRVGRCLDWLYPDDLDTAIGREPLVDRLEKLLSAADHRPVLLVGPSGAGKTAIIHEWIRRRVARRSKRNATRQNCWLLAPQRIVSGMSYVGQWENRVHAIFKEAVRRKHTLVFDDLPGLFRAGQSSGSDLCVADLLKTELLRGNLHVLAEITDAGFDKLTETDRSFADLFHVERIPATGEQQTLRIAIAAARELEVKFKTTFEHDVIPTATQLQRQYRRQVAFPGKLCHFLKSMAAKFHHQVIDREKVLQEFCDSMGISMEMVHDNITLDQQTVVRKMRDHVVGQDEAIAACARIASAAKARLNDPTKPLGTLLFLGPTGVGKTECAKALARIMFGSAERMSRFDLNEYKTAYAAARLIGTLDEPEGLLTSAVRHQPFGIVLLDEIEKAHPDVFDILLQVTGEGRLTDSLGRTTDFTNSIIIMTSNLGARSNLGKLGFSQVAKPQFGSRRKRKTDFQDPPTDAEEHRFVAAAQNFFRPEFFNRIDQVIPFHALTMAQIEMIAEQMMQHVVNREGLVRRRSILQIDHSTIHQVCESGYQPELGARALKRAIEEYFTQPVARQLAQLRSDLPTLVRISRKPASGSEQSASELPAAEWQHSSRAGTVENTPRADLFDVQVAALENAPLTDGISQSAAREQVIECCNSFLQRMRSGYLQQRPAGEIASRAMSPDLLAYFALAEHADKIEALRDTMIERIDSSQGAAIPMLPVSNARVRASRGLVRNYQPGLRWLKDLNSIRDLHRYVDEFSSSDLDRESAPEDVAELVGHCSLFELLAPSAAASCEFAIELYGDATIRRDEMNWLLGNVIQGYQQLLEDLEFSWKNYRFVRGKQFSICIFHVEGCGARALLERESGVQLYCDRHGQLNMMRTGLVSINPANTPWTEAKTDEPVDRGQSQTNPGKPGSPAAAHSSIARAPSGHGLLKDLWPSQGNEELSRGRSLANPANEETVCRANADPAPEANRPQLADAGTRSGDLSAKPAAGEPEQPVYQFEQENLQVLRVYDHEGQVFDWRTGKSIRLEDRGKSESTGWLRKLLIGGLDPPVEFEGLLRPRSPLGETEGG